jgi:pilus assembly protein CpaB
MIRHAGAELDMVLQQTHSTWVRPVIILPVAAILFFAAAILVWSNLQSKPAKGNASRTSGLSTMTMVVIAAHDIAPGQVMAAEDISLRAVNADRAPSTTLHQIADVENHMALSPIKAGAAVTGSAISANAIQGLAAHIPVGYRAYAISVSEADIAGGFLQVGDHVDLYITLPGALFGVQDTAGHRPNDQSKSTLLLQSVAVLAVGTKLRTNGAAETMVRTVTLALKPDTLSRIALASRLGTITMGIRNPVDQAPASGQLSTIDTLVGDLSAQPAALSTSAPASTPKPALRSGGGITVYSGRIRSIVHVP